MDDVAHSRKFASRSLQRRTGLISVIMPVYNAECYVGQAVDSCLEQTYTDFELVAVNDFSQDSSAAILESYSDDRIRIFHHAANLGPGAARNTALHHARGEWLTVLDADDCYGSQRLELLHSLAISLGDESIYTDDWADWQLGSRPLEVPRVVGESHSPEVRTWCLRDWLRDFREARPFIHASLLCQAEEWYPADFRVAEDTLFIMNLAARRDIRIHQLMAKTYMYRNTPGSLTTPSLSRSLERLEAYRRIHLVAPPDCVPAAIALIRGAEMDVSRKALRSQISDLRLRGALIQVLRNPRAAGSLVHQMTVFLAKQAKKLQLRTKQRRLTRRAH